MRSLKLKLVLLIFLSCIGVAKAQMPTAAFDVSDTITCIGTPVSFTDMSTGGVGGIVDWQWSFGDASTGTSQNPSHSYGSGGIKTVTLTVTDAAANTSTISHDVFVIEAIANQGTVRICSPQTTTIVSANAPISSAITGYWFTAGSAIIADPTNDTTMISNLTSGSYILFWVLSDGFCSDADQVTIIVDQPVVTNAGPDQTVCVTPGTATMAGSNPSPGTGLWTTTSSATITTPSNRNTGITGLTTPGTYTFVWSVTNGACVNRDTMNIFVVAVPTANAGIDQSVCASPGTTTLSGNTPSSGTVQWTTTGSASITSPTSVTTGVTGLTTAGTCSFIYTITSATGCVGRDTMVVTINQFVTAAAGSDIQVCTSTGTGNLNGSNPAPGTGLWTTTSSASITSPTSASTTATGLTTAGFYYFVWTVTNGACVSRDTMVMIVRAPVVSNAGIDQTLCGVTATTLAGSSPSPGTGVWTTTSSASITTPSSASSGVTALPAGNSSFIWTVTYGACVTRDTMVVRIDAAVTSNAGPDQSLCQTTTTATLAGNSPAPGTGLWTTTSSASITTPTSATSGITGLTVGTHTFVWTVTNGACVQRDTMQIVVSASVTSNAGVDQNICTSTGTATLAATAPSPGSGVWSTTSSATITTPSSASSGVTGLTTAGTYNFIWTVTNGACVARDTISIVVSILQNANAGPDQFICETTTSANMAGNAASPGTGTWTTSSSATITSPNSAISSITGLTVGTHTFVWTITNGSCTSRDTMQIVVSAEEVADAGSDQQICSDVAMTTLSANTPVTGSGAWVTTSTATITNAADPNTTVTDLTTPGFYEFIWIISNGACVSMDTMQVLVDEYVAANAGIDQSLCAVTTTSLHAQGVTTGMGVWISLGVASVTDPLDSLTGVTGLIPGSNQFVWMVSNGICLSFDTMDVYINDLDTAFAGPDQILCSGTTSTSLAATAPVSGTGIWSTTSSATITSPTSPTSGVTGLSTAGTYNFIWTVTNGVCTSTDTVAVIISIVTTANAGSDFQICETQSSANLAGNTAVIGTGTWTTTGSATIASPNNPTTSVSNLVIGTNTFIWTIVNGLCVSSDTVNIVVDSFIVADAGIDQQLCAAVGTINLSATAPSQGSGSWWTPSSAIITDPADPNSTATGLTTAGSYIFIWTVTNGVCLSGDSIVVTVDEDVPADAGPDQNICVTSSTVQLNAATPSSGTGVWISLGVASVDNPLDPQSTVTGAVTGSNQFVWMVSNGFCLNTDTVDIIVSIVVPADAGLDQQICASPGSTTLTGSDPTPGTALWTTTSGAIITDPTQPTTTVSSLLTSGAYEFIYTVTNGGCVVTDTVVINVDDSVIADAGADQHICETAATVQLNAAVPSIGTGVWISLGGASVDNPLDPQSTVTGTVNGSNTFVWMVSNGMCLTTDTVDIIIYSLIAADAGLDQAICASPGSTTLNGNDPTPGTALWTATSSGIFSDSSSATSTVSGLNSGGTYEFIYTITNGGCISSDTMYVMVDDSVIADAGVDMGLCENDTIINLAATPPAIGTGVWISLGVATVDNPLDPASQASGLVMGPNEFVWMVSNGMCLMFDTVVVTLNQIPTVPNAGADFSICSDIDSVTLSGNMALVGVSQWNSLGGATISNPADSIVTVSNLSIGINTFTYVINNGGCLLCDTVYVTVNPVPVADAGSDQFATASTPVPVGGSPTGSGGMPPYTYNWNPGTLLNDSTNANPTATATVTTSFVLTVTDSLGCQGLDTMVLYINDPPIANDDTLTIPEDSVITISVLSNDTDTDNNIDSASITFISGPFNGSAVTDTINGTVIYTPNANYFGTDSIQYSICDLGIPVYCDTAWIIINITPVNDAPVAVDDNYTTMEDSCITFNVLLNDTDVENNIDTASFAILMNPSNGTIILDTIAGQMTYCPDTLFNGNDTLTYIICDTGSPVLCDTAVVVITVTPLNNAPVAVNDSIVICSSDSIVIDVLANDTDAEGDTLNVTLNSVAAHGTTSLNGNMVTYYPDITYNGMDSVQYIACEANNPSMCDTAWIIINVHGVPSLSVTHNNPLCSSDSTGSIDLTAAGNGPFTYSWSSTDTTEDLSAIPQGIYTVTVVDSFGCSSVLTDTIAAPNPLIGSSVLQHVNCYGDSTGAIDITIAGGLAPYTYNWSTTATTEDISALIAGVYSVSVTDSNGCWIQITDTVLQPNAPLGVTGISTDVACASDSIGTIDITVTGGTAPYTYVWSTTATTEDIGSLPAGIYSVTVTDSSGCSFVYTDTVNSTNPPINLSYTVVSSFCIDSVAGSIDATAIGGTGTLTYLWSNGFTTEDLTGLYAGVYILTVTDSLGCFNIVTVNLNDTSVITLNVSGAAAICQNDSLTLSVANYVNASYQWFDNTATLIGTSPSVTVGTAGSYFAVATSPCGIFVSDTVNVMVNALPIVSVIDTASTTCDSSIVLTAAGGVSFLWSPVETINDPTLPDPTVSPLVSTIYIVAVTDSNGCVAYDSVSVDVTCVTLTVPNGFSPNGDGFNDNFVIAKIEDYPNNMLRIFNRWGNMVYEMHSYDNSWNGNSNVNSIMMNAPLPDGTYYYVLDLGNNTDMLTGFIVLKK